MVQRSKFLLLENSLVVYRYILATSQCPWSDFKRSAVQVKRRNNVKHFEQSKKINLVILVDSLLLLVKITKPKLPTVGFSGPCCTLPLLYVDGISCEDLTRMGTITFSLVAFKKIVILRFIQVLSLLR